MTKMLADQVKKSLKSVKSLSLLLKVCNARSSGKQTGLPSAAHVLRSRSSHYGGCVEQETRLGSILRCLVQVVRSLLQNEQLALDDYLQQVIPVVLTCVVAKELGASARDDHWAVRDLAATAMGALLEKFGPAYPELLSRVSNQLLKGLLDPSKPLTTHYGTALSPALPQA